MGHNLARAAWRENWRHRLAGFRLPYTFDPSGLPNGALPFPWAGPTWSVSAAKGVNTPTLGSELFPAGGLEGTYTGGKCDDLGAAAGAPTLAESADSHGGSKAQQFTGNALLDEIAVHTGLTNVGQWYLYSIWGKRSAVGANRLVTQMEQVGEPVVNYGMPFVDAAYKERRHVQRSWDGSLFGCSIALNIYVGGTDTTILDDISIKQITHQTLFALLNASQRDITAKAKWTFNYNLGGLCGVVARADKKVNPSTFLLAYYHLQSIAPYCYCYLFKCVNGVYTQLIKDWSNSPVFNGGDVPTNTQWLEIRCSGTTVQLFHNNIQVGANQTVSDVTGTHAGVFDTGASQLETFMVSLT